MTAIGFKSQMSDNLRAQQLPHQKLHIIGDDDQSHRLACGSPACCQVQYAHLGAIPANGGLLVHLCPR